MHTMKPKIISAEVYFLMLFLAIEAICALFGGYNLMRDPSGESLYLPENMLEGSVLPNYLIPGIFLFNLLGIFPLLLIYPLLMKPKWPKLNGLNMYKNYHWAWTYSLYISIILLLWISFQLIILDYGSIIQGIFNLLGIVILVLVLLPATKRHFRVPKHTRSFESRTKS